MSLQSLALIENWPVPTAAAGVVRGDGTVLGTHGPVDRRFRLASVTKPLAAYAALVAYEEGAIELDEPAGPPGSTVRHLLAHTSGLAFDEHRVTAPPGERRLYSNAGFEQLGDHIAEATEIPFPEYLRQAVLEPLGMTSTSLEGSPAKDGFSTVGDLLRFAAELQAPRLLDPRTVAEAMTVQYPGTKGVLPGYGHQNPNDWGSASRSATPSHRTGRGVPPRRAPSGTSVSRVRSCGSTPPRGSRARLTDRAFGAWAVEVWPVFTDAVLAEAR